MDIIDFYLEDLKSRFRKIKPEKYYLSYSGGKDSHFIFWFLRTWLKENDFEMYEEYLDVKIIGVNTYMEHPQIRKRIYENCDRVLLPAMKPFEIKAKYGSPCFSKTQDDWIDRYQRGCRRPYLIERIMGIHKDTGEEVKGRFKLSKTAKNLLLGGKLHKISAKCCWYLKKKPCKQYEKESGRKPILGVRGSESALREVQYKSCFTKKGVFTPLHDLSDEVFEYIYKKYNIETPPIYEDVSRTGCMGCPYGSYYGYTSKELRLINERQRKFICEYFKESYEVLGIDTIYLKEGDS